MDAVRTSARSALSVRRFDGVTSDWDAFVARADGATFCHLAAWREIVAEAMGAEPLYSVCVDDDGRWQGVLPLVRVRSRLFGHYLVSMPFLNYGGPLGDPAALRALVAVAVQEAHRSRADLLEIRARAPFPSDLRPSFRKLTVLLDLPPSEEALWRDRFDAKLRNGIRRALREEMETRLGADQRDAFYDVFARHMRELGTPALPALWFRRIAECLGEHVLFGVVYWRGRPVAAGCGFVWRDELEMTWASSLREHNRRNPNTLLYWAFLQEAIRRGLSVFNFGRCTPGSGTHRFKLQWGGYDVPLPWGIWSRRGATATPTPDGPLYRVATAVWRRLPLPVTNRIGPLLARRIP